MSFAALASTSACGSASPMSSAATRISRRAMNSGSSPPVQHARQPVERGVRVGAADRLMQGGDEVVVLLAVLVVGAGLRFCSTWPAPSASSGWPGRCRTGSRPGSARSGRRRRPWRAAPRAPPASAAGRGPRRLGALQQAARARPRPAARSTSTWQRDSSAPFSSKDGFSVVAPTRVTSPPRRTGRKPSCWARLKRWISSTNSRVAWPASRRSAGLLERLLQVGDAGEHRRELLEL